MKMIGNVSDWLSYAGGALIKVADSAGSTVYSIHFSKTSYCTADLWLCFRQCKLLVFPCGGSYNMLYEKTCLLQRQLDQ